MTFPIRLKVEINTREIEAYDPPQALALRIDNPWFAGEAPIPTFSREEMLATKLRALLQRDKGRDLYDLSHALFVFDGLDVARVTELFGRYLQLAGQSISRAQAEERMFAKLANPRLLTDMRPLLPAAQSKALSEDATNDAFERVFEGLIAKIAGDTWVRTEEMKERFRLTGSSAQNFP
ncbi:nucleotidyl transferase AbiEii/AbiGii toxin family protein [Mesorhizobium sp. WSM2239]|uniref:Nucleotidyl transferase AbiEii/AbiGii toxin family protein n=2 Tax=unclassified Mesorhizobium TaxID=325217 RepID=A0AAU8D740_9HYPH